MPLTVLICAIWLVTCALSIGFSGSWFCICATSSFRKRSALPASLAVARACALAPLSRRRGRDRASMARCMHWPDLQRLQQQAARRVHDFDVVLVRARGRDHVDHLLHRVDVAVGDVALGVGAGVLGVVHAAAGAVVLGDRRHAHAGAGAALAGPVAPARSGTPPGAPCRRCRRGRPRCRRWPGWRPPRSGAGSAR